MIGYADSSTMRLPPTKDSISWNIDLHTVPTGTNTTLLLEIIEKTLKLWSGNSALVFVRSDSPMISLKFGRIDGPHGHVAATECVSGCHGARTIVFDNAEKWSLHLGRRSTNNKQYDFWNVLAHEIGHAMGLGHATEPESLMHSIYIPRRFYLSAADREHLFRKREKDASSKEL